ncbi:hypothetical protein HQ865_10015 [Mucilaginibacter mali]|uniref:DUF4168 domain-containing protein n=1 Tax=Mucilaginibacter mali TaxID=2740462 RepID=A0A7D4UD24_9SPHI|nr:hypothetical protein [Mucilaginibacter mali]QKJ30079.1 hypothetical protein HQ865_10015 [Mucilaginibacter mali]
MKKSILLGLLFSGLSIASFAQTKPKAKTKATDSVAVISQPLKDLFGEAGMMGMMNSFGPMVSNMAKSMMDAQLEYYKQPGKLEEIAKLNKQYFDALVKEGFTADQALKIVTSDSFLPKGNGVK